MTRRNADAKAVQEWFEDVMTSRLAKSAVIVLIPPNPPPDACPGCGALLYANKPQLAPSPDESPLCQDCETPPTVRSSGV
jgi:hypothetical protein